MPYLFVTGLKLNEAGLLWSLLILWMLLLLLILLLMTSTKPVILKNAKDEHLFRILGFYVGLGTVENIVANVDDVFTLIYGNITKLMHFQIINLHP